MYERQYQALLIRKLEKVFPGCFILKNDSSYLQGIPDLLVLYNDRWAMLEVKQAVGSYISPNQIYYLNLLDGMSFAALIYPENESQVLNDLQHAFSVGRTSRVSKRK